MIKQAGGEFLVDAVVQILADTYVVVHDPAFEKETLRRNKVVEQRQEPCRAMRLVVFGDLPVEIAELQIGIDPVDRRIAQYPRRGMEGPAEIEIIAVQPGDDIPGRHPEPFVQRMALSMIRFRHPPDMRIFFQHLERIVPGTIVDDDVLEIRIVLDQDAANGVLNKAALVEGGRYNGIFICRYLVEGRLSAAVTRQEEDQKELKMIGRDILDEQDQELAQDK